MLSTFFIVVVWLWIAFLYLTQGFFWSFVGMIIHRQLDHGEKHLRTVVIVLFAIALVTAMMGMSIYAVLKPS